MISSKINQLKKGCDKNFETDTKEGLQDWVCGDSYRWTKDEKNFTLKLCDVCKAKALGYMEMLEEIKVVLQEHYYNRMKEFTDENLYLSDEVATELGIIMIFKDKVIKEISSAIEELKEILK